jgi:4-hydroxybenzoate polyprenyltransferase
VRVNLVRLITVVLMGLGVMGFIPALVARYDSMTFAGPGSTAVLFGVFEVSVLGNLIHLALGITGVAVAGRTGGTRRFLFLAGLVLLLLAAYGWIVDPDSAANFVPVNHADNWLHLCLGAGMIALAYPRKPRS